MAESHNHFVQLLRLLPRRSRWILGVIIPALILNSVLEVGAISLLMPFVQELSGKPSSIGFKWFAVYDWLATHVVPANRLLSVGIALVVLFILKNIYQAVTWYGAYRFVQMRAAATATQLFREYLDRPYEFHLATNSSVLISHVTQQVGHVFSSVLLPMLYLGSEAVTVLLLIVLMLKTAALATLVTLVLVTAIAVAMTRVLRPMIQRNAKKYMIEEALLIRWVTQGLAGFKEIKVLGKEDFVAKQFSRSAREYGYCQLFNTFLAKIPRLVAEPTVLAIIVVFLAIATLRSGSATAIGGLALFGAASLRLIPSFTMVNTMVNKVRFSLPALEMLTTELALHRQKPKPTTTPLPFDREVALQDVSHQYPIAARPTLKSVSLRICPGDHISIVGPSGSGKTTLVSILLGLITPTHGSVLVDGQNINVDVRRWHQTLGYVPQDMFLLDDTIRNNICLGISQSPEADARLWRVLDTAGLSDFVQSLPEGLETRVGERGTQISGGQRQRIGLARALFDGPRILILDEATSGLDRDTERTVLESIFLNEPQLTMVLVTHRLETAQLCKQMVEIKDGRVRQLSNAYQPA